jgi:exopolyphosphatase/guanosine-5'-triphosphate,3'-diphosphate pyrophosphatase
LTEDFLGTKTVAPRDLVRARAHIEHALSTVTLTPAPQMIIGVAGTVTTLAAMAVGLTTWDPHAVQGYELTRDRLLGFIDQLLPTSPEERRTMAAISPDRADYLLAGATVLCSVLERTRQPHMVVSNYGLRFGLLSECHNPV